MCIQVQLPGFHVLGKVRITGLGICLVLINISYKGTSLSYHAKTNFSFLFDFSFVSCFVVAAAQKIFLHQVLLAARR